MVQLAVHGGSATAPAPNLVWPRWGDEERHLLEEVLRSGKWWRGAYDDAAASKVRQFEAAFTKMRYSHVERIFTTAAVRLPHALLLGSARDMGTVLRAIAKLWRHQHK
jgi:hypothetical protein